MVSDRLIRYLLACSDVEGALHVMGKGTYESWLYDYVRRHWPQMFDPWEYGSIYADAGHIEASVQEAFWVIPQGLRYRLLLQFLSGRFGGKSFTLLDYGCSRGFFSTHLAREFPTSSFFGLDIDETSTTEAEKYAKHFAPDIMKECRLWFAQGTNEDGWRYNWGSDGFDCVVLMEVLEHVPDVTATLNWAWDRLLPDGWMFITVPHGPIEYVMWLLQPHRRREHVRELREDALRLMFLGAGEVVVEFHETGVCGVTNLKTGMTVAAFRKSGNRPTFVRDLDALLTAQVPETARLALPT